ncbi:uncharacterized protein LOC112345102 isoform X2 [Selaginella moellendorffii]|uniref:uncharacterized protein LOC112345102 isoform X2 n=1 Tax=Selaginella moellendorffii TaxID=88036 RepID=UPI000D1C2794|nr:uncharacterized protein LOC112345102 isoform X2 [Selaginella moellendorffii]|eukprot:XP_024526920.1 uncharacterized protein LOC112345102 isoform X2 [Selaginella moellendorffii]
MATASTSSIRQQQGRQPEFKYIVPLIYAPILPLIRLAFRKNPEVRDRVFAVALGMAFVHGGYVISELYQKESSRQPKL